MPNRLPPRQVAKLAKVQHVRKAACQASLNAAREAETAAGEERLAAESNAAGSVDAWLGCMAEKRFEPERARDLAVRLIVCETTLHAAVAAHDRATELHASRQTDFRVSAAQVDLADTMLKDASRAAGVRREERRLTDLADRVTYRWTRP